MRSLFATWSHPLPFVVCHQLLRAIIVQHHCHLPPSLSSSAEVAVSCHSQHRQSAVSAVSRCCLSMPSSLVCGHHPSNLSSVTATAAFLVGGRHHRHLSSAVAVPLVASAHTHQLQRLISATVTSSWDDDLLRKISWCRHPPIMFSTLLISCSRRAHRCCDHHSLSPLLPTHKHPAKQCNWTAADGRLCEINGGGATDSGMIDGWQRQQCIRN